MSHANSDGRVLSLGTHSSQAVTIRPCKTAKWVTLSRLSYGIPEDIICNALACYGRVIQVKMHSYRGVYIGTRMILMDISNPIPSRIRIAGHWCHIFYSGQIQTCFACDKSGHTQKDCPDRRGARDASQLSGFRTSANVHLRHNLPLSTATTIINGGRAYHHPLPHVC